MEEWGAKYTPENMIMLAILPSFTTFEIVYCIFVAVFITIIISVFISLFTHAWVRGGYTNSLIGKPGTLENHEVTLFVAHVTIAVCVTALIAMIFAEPVVIKHIGYGFGWESKLCVLSISAGSGAYAAFKKLKNGLSGFSDDVKP